MIQQNKIGTIKELLINFDEKWKGKKGTLKVKYSINVVFKE